MTNSQMWSVIIGFFVPPLLAIVQQPGWSQPLRAVVTFITAIGVGLGTLYFAGNLDFSNHQAVITSVLLVLVTAVSTYGHFWKPTGVAPGIEQGTSPSPPTP